MLKAMTQAAAARRSASNSRRSSLQSTPYESVMSDDSSSSYSEDSDYGRSRRNRRKAVSKRKSVKPMKTDEEKAQNLRQEKDAAVESVPKRKARAKASAKRKDAPEPYPDELVKIARKEGTTKFHQMRRFLEKANEADTPTDILSGFLASRKVLSPNKRGGSPRSSLGSVEKSPRVDDFHTGLTPTSSQRPMPSPVAYFGDSYSRRDSDEGFAANDLLANNGESVDNKIGSFIHGQRSLNLRRQMNTVASGDNIQLALMMEEIPDMHKRLEKMGKQEQRKRIIVNTSEGDENAPHAENLDDDSQLGELEAEMLLGL